MSFETISNAIWFTMFVTGSTILSHLSPFSKLEEQTPGLASLVVLVLLLIPRVHSNENTSTR